MAKIIAIAAVEAQTGAIGYRGGLIYRNSKDMAHFKEATMGNIVLAGGATIASLAANWPLFGRHCSEYRLRKPGLAPMADYARAMRAKAEALGCDVYIIGGGKTYAEWLPHCDYLDLTLVYDAQQPQADCFFPLAEAKRLFDQVSSGNVRTTDAGLRYEFTLWARKQEPAVCP